MSDIADGGHDTGDSAVAETETVDGSFWCEECDLCGVRYLQTT